MSIMDRKSVEQIPFSVAVPTYRRGECLLRTLEDVFVQEPKPDEILLLDQTERHEPKVEMRLRSWKAENKIKRIRLADANLPAARNVALRTVNTPVLIFLDDDVRLGKDFFAAHLRHFAEGAAAVTGRVQEHDHWRPYRRDALAGAEDSYLDFNYKSARRRDGVARISGGNHSVSVTFMRKIGGYDERFTGCAIYEDVDAGLRIWRAGGRIVYEPDAYLNHSIERTGGCRSEVDGQGTRLDEEVYLANYFLFKNFFPGRHFREQYCRRHLRRFLFNSRYLKRPWLFPHGVGVFIAASWRAWRNRNDPRYLFPERK